LHGVAGGDTVRRLKAVGVQLVQAPTANLTNILLSSVPYLLAGNPGVASVTATGQYDDGSTFPLNVLPGTTFGSDNTGVFTVDVFGGITPAQAGTAHLIVSSGSISVTNPITVLAPSVVRLTMSPTNLYIGGGTAPYHDAVAAALFADFAPAA